MTVVLALAEARMGKLRDVSFELVSAGRALKEQGATRLVVALVDRDPTASAEALNLDGVDEVVTISSPIEEFEPHAAAQALEALIDDVQPDLILLGHTVDTLGFGAAVAAKLRLGFAADVVSVELGVDRPAARRGAYGDRVLSRVEFPGHDRVLVQVRPGTYERASGEGSAARRALEVSFDSDALVTRHVEYQQPEAGDVDITAADFLLSVGRGLDDRDQLERFQRLAERLGATLSVSRPLVDAGWAPASLQVGQSGKTVKPKVYLAMGISGAVQHLAGMSEAEMIIAVNTDPEAPIFSVAHYGAVADLFEVADELEQTLGQVLLAAVETRQVFWHFTTGLRVLWYVLAVASVLVFAYGASRPVARWRRGRGGSWPPCPWRELPRRLSSGFGLLLSHATMGRRNRFVGWAHRGIFYGFAVLFLGTVVLAFDTDFTDPVFGWDYFHGPFYLGYKEVLNLLGTVLVVGVVAMMVRRARKPVALDYRRPDRTSGEPQFDRGIYRFGDWAFVGSLLVITLTGFLLEGVRIAMDDPGYGATQFVGWILAQGMTGISEPVLAGMRHGLWWFHGLVALVFVASIPYTKAAHMLTSFLALSLRDPLAGKRLPQIPPERASEPAGYGALVDFSPLHLIHLDACTKCGRCHEVCPANATGRPLSPRDVILELRDGSADADSVGGVLGSLLRRDVEPDIGLGAGVIGAGRVHEETLWSCMQCNACVEVCPVGIEQAPIINQMRRRLVEEGDIDPGLQATLEVIHKSGNSFGENRRRRGRWAAELPFAVKDARKEPVDVLWFVGDYASFDPRSQQVSRTIAGLLHAADLDFGLLFDGERNAGNDVRRVGEEGLFESLASQNIETIAGCDFRRILTSDPHSLNTLKNEYPELIRDEHPELMDRWLVQHHTELLLELLDEGRLALPHPLSYRVTYHDPCYLGRHNGVYEDPRELLRRLGCELVEMPRNRDNGFCCGAGGGQIWMKEPLGDERPAENRIAEALAIEPVDFFVVACPKDVTMFEDAIKTSGATDRIALREITELVEEAFLGETAARAELPVVG